MAGWPPILVRYGEIGIKSRQVRHSFERKLVERIEEQLLVRGLEAEVERVWGRIFVRAADAEAALDALCHTFGIVSVSPAIECASAPQAIAAAVLEVARERLATGGSFATRVKRAGQHSFTSLDVAKACAARILDDLAEREPRVDLDAPDVEIHVEVRDGGAFVFTRTQRGPGGLPLGSQGRVGVFVDSPRAAHAAWLVARRGSMPLFFSRDADEPNAREWLAVLSPWIRDIRIRRAPDRAATAPYLAEQRCLALVVADGVEDAVKRAEEDRAVGYPVFRPLVGFPGKRFDALDRQVRS